MTDQIETVIAQCRLEGTLRALSHLDLSDYPLTPDDWDRIVAALKVNGGRPPSEKTEVNHQYLAHFLLAYRAQKTIEGRGGMMRALRIVLPQFSSIPNDPENPHGLARRIVGGKRPDITKLANSLRIESKALGNDVSGRNS